MDAHNAKNLIAELKTLNRTLKDIATDIHKIKNDICSCDLPVNYGSTSKQKEDFYTQIPPDPAEMRPDFWFKYLDKKSEDD